MNKNASALPGSTSVGVRCPAICSRPAISLLSIVFNTAPASRITSTCSIAAFPLEKFVIRSSYTRCVFPSDPANATGASRTSSSTGVIVSVTACCCAPTPQASPSQQASPRTQIRPVKIGIAPRLYHAPLFLPLPPSSTGIPACAPSPTRHPPLILAYRRDIVFRPACALPTVLLHHARSSRPARTSLSGLFCFCLCRRLFSCSAGILPAFLLLLFALASLVAQAF